MTQLLIAVLTVLLVGWGARASAGPGGALAAMVSLGMTQNFFFYAPMTLLDGVLMLGAAMVVAGALRPRLDAAAGWLMFGGTLVGVATKAPFGLVTPVALIAGRVIVERSVRWAARATALTVLATLPVVLFVATSSDWLEHYGREQLIASMNGTRSDGGGGPLFPARMVLEMFWPGLALIAFGVLPVRRRLCGTIPEPPPRSFHSLSLGGVLAIAALSLPARKLNTHVFVLFPMLSALAGAAVGPAVDRLPVRITNGTLLLLLATGLIAGPLGIARLYCRPACALSTVFAPQLDALPPGTEVDIVSRSSPWSMIALLAAERRFLPFHVAELGAREWAVVERELWVPRSGWSAVSEAPGWYLVRRDP
ncbi:MAG: hypothetical protein JNJ54_30685 [Myxococcaceae bacterium]|nr:hypothetical protein [Myxococcaceae bacterium]